MNSTISFQLGPYSNDFTVYHVSIACFSKRALR